VNWKKIAIWSGSIVAVLIVLLVVAVVVLTHTNVLHHYILAKVEKSVSQSLGAQVNIGSFTLHVSPLSVDLYDDAIHGPGPESTRPLLHADGLHIGVEIVSILQGKWRISDVQLDHPVARVFVDAEGNNNLPKPSTSSSQTNIFDLAIRHAVINNGEVYYNNRKSVLDADLHDLQFNSSYEASRGGRYIGDIGYRDGHLQFGSYAPLPHALQAHFDATRSGMTFSPTVLRSGPSELKVNASIENYSSPVIRATYDATLATAEFRRMLHNTSLPLGVVQLSGSLQYHSNPNQPLLEAVSVEGKLSSQTLRVQTPQLTTDITGIAAAYSLAHGNAAVHDLRAHILGGELTGQMLVRDISGNSHSHLQASLRGVSLADLNPVLNTVASSPSVRPAALSGFFNADADATWGRTMNDLVATVDADLHGTAAPRAQAHLVQASNQPSSNPIPFDATIHAHYVAAKKQITLTNTLLRTPHTSIALNGTVSNRSSLQVRLVSGNLHDLEVLADSFRKPTPGQPIQPLGLGGKASFIGSISGTTSAPQITGQLIASVLQVKGSSWKTIRTNVALSPSLVSLQNGTAQPLPQGHITFNLQAELQKWSFTSSSPLQVSLNASRINLADLLHITGSNAPVSGTLNANVSVHGSELNPIGQGTAALTQAKLGGEPVQALNLQFQGTGEVVHANLNVRMPAGTAQGNVVYYPKQEGYEASFQAPNINLAQLQTVAQKKLGISGVLTVSASGRGTINNPELQATASIPQLVVRGQDINDVRLAATVQNKVANVALDSNAVNTSIRGRAKIELTGNYQADATLDTQRIPLKPLLAIYSPAEAADMSGQTELHATLHGPLKNKSQLQAQAELPVFTLSYKTIQLGAVAPIRANYTNGVVTIEPAEIRGTGTDLKLHGSIPVSSFAPASVLLLGNVDLRLLQIFDPTVESSGELRFNINSFGSSANLNTEGEIQIVNASLATSGAPIGLQKANGTLTLRNDRLEISRFQGSLGGGTLTASGAVIYHPSLQFNVAVAANGVRVAYPQGVRTGLDANLALTGSPANALLRGQVRLTSLYFTPDFDISSFASQFNQASAPAPGGGFAQNLQINVAVLSTQLNAVSRTVSLKGSANLTISGTADQPVVLGRVNLTGGDLLFFGNRYVIHNGTVAFVNAVQTEPVLNVEASTRIDQYNIQLRFQGPLDRLRTTYSSDPSLPPADIIHLLAFGQTTESAAANPTPGSLGAESVLAQGVSNQVTSRIQKVAGISHLAISPTLGSTTQSNPSARISVQQRVTSNLFVTFESDVTSTQNQVIQLQYQINPRWSVSTTRNQNGGFSFEANVHQSF
jgi:translocation and assembly module TamB